MKRQRLESQQNNFSILLVTKSIFLGIMILLLGLYLIPYLIHLLITNLIVISPDRPLFYSIWLNPPVPVYFNVTMFNVTNPDEIEKGMGPRLKEVGPYVFEEIRNKINISLDDEKDTATYIQHVRYEFVSELSGNRSLNDVITMLNVPYVAAAVRVERSVPWPLNHFVHMILLNYKEPLFVQKTVEEALFKGWKVPLLEKIEEDTGLTFLENNTFSFFMGMNNTNQGPYTIMRGIQGDKRHLGEIIKYKGEPVLPFWGDRNSRCNKIMGTDAFIFPPFNTKNAIVQAFNADLCGSLNLEYNSDVEIEGVYGFKYTIQQSQLASARESTENRCLCAAIDREPEKCLARGVVDLGPCRDGAPIALSLPHFLDADPVYLQDIEEGLNPEREKHELAISLEPVTGIVMQANKRFQLSMILKPVSSIPALSEVKDMLFPCLWADEGARLDQPNGQRLRMIMLLINLTEDGFKFASLVIAIVIQLGYLRKQLQSETSVYDKVNKDANIIKENVPDVLVDKSFEEDHFLHNQSPYQASDE